MSFLKTCCAALALLSGAASVAFGQSPAQVGNHLPSQQSLRPFGLTRAWWGQAVMNSHRDKLLHITTDERELYTQSTNGVLTAFDSETGKRLWSTQVGSSDRAMYPVTSNDDMLFVVSGMSLYGISKLDGQIQWDLRMPGQPATSPIADNREMYLGFMDGSMYAFDLKRVGELYAKSMLPRWSHLTVLWRYKTSQTISVPAVPGARLVAFASRNGSLYSVTKEDRTLKFQFQTNTTLSAPFVRWKNNLLLASEDFNVYSLDMANGRYNWQFSSGMMIRKTPVVIGDELYLTPERGGMFKISPETGKQIWWRPGIEEFISASPTRVYASDRMGNVAVLSRQDGGLIAAMPAERFTRHVVNDRSDRLFLATETGLIVELHELGRDAPLYHVHPDWLPLMPEFAPEMPNEVEGGAAPPAAEQPEAAARDE